MPTSHIDSEGAQGSLSLDFDPDAPVREAHAEAPAGLAPRDAEAWLRLHRLFALSPERLAAPLEAGATAEEILEMLSGTAAAAQRPDTAAWDAFTIDSGRGRPAGFERRFGRDLERDVENETCRLERLGARVVPRSDRAYPERLRALTDAPCVLLVRGRAESLAGPGIAIVGARAATEPARQTARRLARELAAQGLSIISGLARGIDAAAHRGALEAGGRTIAVLACGPDRIYPPEHRGLAREICERGAVVSELPLGAPPKRSHFPLRNRLISGLSLGVIVVEARRRSGSLITVRHALNQGRDVFVVPGSVEGPFAEGTNALLREGARPVRNASDVLEDLGLAGVPNASAIRNGGGAMEGSAVAPPSRNRADGEPSTRIVALLEEESLSQEELAERSGLVPGVLARALLELELADRVVLDRDGRLRLRWR